MKFPLINNGSMVWRSYADKNGNVSNKHKCPLCGKKRKDGVFIALSGGALKGDKNNAMMDNSLVGFLSLELHDHDEISGGSLDIVDSSPSGQFEFYFCSSKCLRKFFDKVVDAFEKTLE